MQPPASWFICLIPYFLHVENPIFDVIDRNLPFADTVKTIKSSGHTNATSSLFFLLGLVYYVRQ